MKKTFNKFYNKKPLVLNETNFTSTLINERKKYLSPKEKEFLKNLHNMQKTLLVGYGLFVSVSLLYAIVQQSFWATYFSVLLISASSIGTIKLYKDIDKDIENILSIEA